MSGIVNSCGVIASYYRIIVVNAGSRVKPTLRVFYDSGKLYGFKRRRQAFVRCLSKACISTNLLLWHGLLIWSLNLPNAARIIIKLQLRSIYILFVPYKIGVVTVRMAYAASRAEVATDTLQTLTLGGSVAFYLPNGTSRSRLWVCYLKHL